MKAILDFHSTKLIFLFLENNLSGLKLAQYNPITAYYMVTRL